MTENHFLITDEFTMLESQYNLL